MAISTDRGTAIPGQYKVVGTRATRLDGLDKVTGVARFGADIHLAGMLHGKILTSPHAHARVLSIDTSKAEAVPGVKAVITAMDFPVFNEQPLDLAAENLRNARTMAEYFLANEKVLFVGHPVAAIAATSPHIAEEAAKLIQVEYEVLPAVLTIQDALREDAPLVHENMTTLIRGGLPGEEDTDVKSNIAGHVQFKRGDLEQGFKEADVIIEKEFSTRAVHPGYIEPFASTAQWAIDDHVTIWTTTQGIFGVREGTAAIIGIPESMLKVIPMECGGGFGGKGQNTNCLNPMAAILSKKTGQPVKMVMSRKEIFESTCPASATNTWVKIGADKSGRITAAKFYLAYQGGAFPGAPVVAGASTGLAPYNIDDFLVDGYDVVTNTQKMQSYRAPGQPPAIYAIESVIDELAEKLEMDPLDFRLKNVVEEWDRMPTGVQYPLIACKELEEAMMAHPHCNIPLDGPNRGRGISLAMRALGSVEGSPANVATINVNTNGTISLITGSMDLSGTRTTVAMQAAEILGLAVEDVISTTADTGGPISCTGYTPKTGAGGAIFAGNIGDVEVDPETGKVKILRYTSFLDVGKAIHPSFVERADPGRNRPRHRLGPERGVLLHRWAEWPTPPFLDYRMPTSRDLPMIDTVIVEVPNPNHPFGMRARVGEIPIVPPIAALANAVYHATGTRMTRTPMTPGAIMKVLEEKPT